MVLFVIFSAILFEGVIFTLISCKKREKTKKKIKYIHKKNKILSYNIT